VLTCVEDTAGKRWVPADSASGGDAVIHPPGLPEYAIVAAGAVLADGQRDSTMYNGLTAKTFGPALIHVTFDGYERPKDRFTYVVKALPVFDGQTREMLQNQMPTVAFDVFLDDGFLLFIFAGNKPIDSTDVLARMRVMIEVSQYAIAG
jgi:hypothetical protein